MFATTYSKHHGKQNWQHVSHKLIATISVWLRISNDKTLMNNLPFPDIRLSDQKNDKEFTGMNKNKGFTGSN